MAGLQDTRTAHSNNAGSAPELAETTAPPASRAHDPLATQASDAKPWEKPVARGSDSGDPPRVGRFVVLREIGRGAMGIVYAAYDDELDRRVALKLVQLGGHDDPSLGRNQLLREAQALARLSHPNVVAVHETGVFEGAVFIAMEFVDGGDLQRWLAAKPRSWRDVVGALRQAGEGLRAAHAVGMVHRDFKPSNVLVGDDGRVRVADFGLATRRGRTGRSGHVPTNTEMALASTGALATLAGSGALVGTPAYMAPEQLRREPATAASDQFAFCIALHEALYGQRPFVADSFDGLIEVVLHRDPPPPPPASTVPPWLHAIVARGLAKDPARRFSGMDELLALLAHDPETERERRRQRLVQLAVAVAATIVLVLGGVYVYRAVVRGAHERRAEARLEVLREQLAGLAARKRDDEAARLFDAFADLPDNRGTAALARAFREWGEHQTDHAAAIDAHAGAYIAARTPEDQAAALRSLALRLARSGAVPESAAALAALDARAPAGLADGRELASLRVAAALDRRDLEATRVALGNLEEDDATRTYSHVLEHLSRGTWIDRAGIGQQSGRYHGFRLGDFDGDGRPEIATHADLRDTWVVLRTDPALTRIAEVPVVDPRSPPIPLPPAFGGAPLLLVATDNPGGDGNSTLLEVLYSLGGKPPVHVWKDSPVLDAEVADLDGDGALELYTGSGPYARKLSLLQRDDRGAWVQRPAHPPTDAVASDVNALAAGDVDGDGRPELVVAVGAWSAYDLRVLRADDHGELHMLARRTFGFIADVAVVQGGDRPRIAFTKQDLYENPGRFSEATPFGDPPGLYIVELQAGALEVVQFFPAPHPDPSHDFDKLTAVDLDGDGRDDLVSSSSDDLALIQRHDDRFLDPLWLRGISLLAAADFDNDPKTELLVKLPEDPDRYLLLGVGDDPLPALPARPSLQRPIRADLDDPAIADAWRHAEELAAIGLPRRSAAELAINARLSGHAQEDMLLRAAELYSQAGDHAAAAELFLAAADRPDLALAALTGAIQSQRALGDFDAARALAATRAALPGLATGVRSDAEDELAALQRATEARPELALRFDRPLDPGWRIVDPLAFARDPGSDSLSFQSSFDRLVAELPLEWDGGTVGLTVDVAYDHLEWGSQLTLAITPAGSDELWLGLRFEAHGQGERPSHDAAIATGPRGHGRPVASAEAGGMGRIRLGLRHFPALGATLREFARDGEPALRTLVPSGFVPAALPPGPLRLRLYNTPVQPETVSHVRIFSIDLVGLRPGAPIAGDDDGMRDLARLIAEGDLGPALQRLAGAPAGSLRSLWRADLLAQVGRIDDAAKALRDGLAGLGPDHEFRYRLGERLVRDPDPFTFAARRVLGPELHELFMGASHREYSWRPARVRFLLADLAAEPLTPPPANASADVHRHHRHALFLRGLAWLRAGRHDLATRDLEALAPLLEGPDHLELRRYVVRRLIGAATRLRDSARLRRWITALLTESLSPDLTLESIRGNIGPLLTPADWARFEALARRR